MYFSWAFKPGFVVLVFFCLQWVAAYKIAGNVIFSASRKADVQHFSTMISAISTSIETKCGQHKINKVLFDDRDIISPYLTGDHQVHHCQLIRETAVTPFTDAEKADCLALHIRAISPPDVSNFSPLQDQETLVEEWFSADKRFGYQMIQSLCAIT